MNTIVKISVLLLLTFLVGLAGGWFLSQHYAAGTAAPVEGTASAEDEILYWVAPMDPEFRRDGPGKSPMGMDLVPVYAGEGQEENAVSISASVEQNLGVRTAPAERRSLFRKIEATGYVGLDETLMRQINVRTEGWIERLAVRNEGERVRKGQLLFEFYSPELVYAQQEFVQARRRGDSRLVGASEGKLRALGMEEDAIQRLAESGTVSENVQVLAPQDGTVTHLNVREGIFIKPDTGVMTLADLSSVWMQVEVFESQADWVAKGQSAETVLNYLPGEVFTGRVDYVYPVLDPETRTLPVRLRFDNPEERLKPNMYAQVTIFGKSHPGALSIPREALIRGARRDRVVVALGGGQYASREVISGIESGEWIEIISGLKPGEQVVTSAQFLIDSEASLAGAVQRLEGVDLASSQAPKPIFAHGVIEAVNTQSRRIRISHGPIEELGWAAMTMEFEVLPAVRLESLDVGQRIQFELGQSEVGDYQVNIINPDANAGVNKPAGD